MSARSAIGLALLLTACSSSPPANWPKGGAPLDLPRARWVRGDIVVDLLQDGRVLVGGEHEMTIDRVGRVVDSDGDPVALLEANGHVVGPDNKDLGTVGSVTASLPDSQQAWLGVMPNGEVIRYGDEGERRAFGVWVGCNQSPSAHQVCTLVSHLLGMKYHAYEPAPSGVTFGVGIGVGVPIR